MLGCVSNVLDVHDSFGVAICLYTQCVMQASFFDVFFLRTFSMSVFPLITALH